jgi:hypothetical protein
MVRIGDAPDSSFEVPTAFNNDIWRKLNDVICNRTTVDDKITPSYFMLEQNYPNPFNPATTISFYLPRRSFVTLKIFDVLGRDVADLLSADLSAGSYRYQWNAQGSPSGVYFYRLQSSQVTGRQTDYYIATKKLILLR